jgi:hypothetical protein
MHDRGLRGEPVAPSARSLTVNYQFSSEHWGAQVLVASVAVTYELSGGSWFHPSGPIATGAQTLRRGQTTFPQPAKPILPQPYKIHQHAHISSLVQVPDRFDHAIDIAMLRAASRKTSHLVLYLRIAHRQF